MSTRVRTSRINLSSQTDGHVVNGRGPLVTNGCQSHHTDSQSVNGHGGHGGSDALNDYTVLEKYDFVPYIEDLSKQSKSVQKYATDCLNFALQGLQDWIMRDEHYNIPNREVLISVLASHVIQRDDALVELYGSNPRCGLAKVLRSMFEKPVSQNMRDKVYDTFKANRDAFHTDMLLSSLHTDDILKPCLDIVAENTNTETISAVEIGGVQNAMYRRVMSIMAMSPSKSMAYTVADLGSAAEFPENVSFIKQTPGENVPTLKDQSTDLLILNHILHKQDDIGKTLDRLSKSVKDGGFLLVKEMTGSFALALILEALIEDKEFPRVRAGRVYGRFLPARAWTELFARQSFDIIFQRSDSVCATLYLLRKRTKVSDTSRPPIYFPVDDVHGSWLEDLQAKMFKLANASSSERLWLVSRKPVSGLVGLVNCLRLEPGGDKVRAICLYDSKASDTSILSVDIKSLTEKDLVFNVFRDGSWGSLRHIPSFRDNLPHVKASFSPDKSYIISLGSNSDATKAMTRWLVERGVTKVILCCRCKDQASQLRSFVQNCKETGIAIEVSGCDVTTVDGAWGLINQAQKLGPLGGVFYLDLVEQPGSFQRQNRDSFLKVCISQAQAVVNLDHVTRALCKDTLDHFVILSSMCSGRGLAGQSNLGFATCVAERVCDLRHADHIPGIPFKPRWVEEILRCAFSQAQNIEPPRAPNPNRLAFQWSPSVEDFHRIFQNKVNSYGSHTKPVHSLTEQDISCFLNNLELCLSHGSSPVVSRIMQGLRHF